MIYLAAVEQDRHVERDPVEQVEPTEHQDGDGPLLDPGSPEGPILKGQPDVPASVEAD